MQHLWGRGVSHSELISPPPLPPHPPRIVNRLMREHGGGDQSGGGALAVRGCINASGVVPEFPLASAALAPLRAKAEAMGCADFSPLWAGQNSSGCREVPAGQLTKDLAAGWMRGLGDQ